MFIQPRLFNLKKQVLLTLLLLISAYLNLKQNITLQKLDKLQLVGFHSHSYFYLFCYFLYIAVLTQNV